MFDCCCENESVIEKLGQYKIPFSSSRHSQHHSSQHKNWNSLFLFRKKINKTKLSLALKNSIQWKIGILCFWFWIESYSAKVKFHIKREKHWKTKTENHDSCKRLVFMLMIFIIVGATQSRCCWLAGKAQIILSNKINIIRDVERDCCQIFALFGSLVGCVFCVVFFFWSQQPTSFPFQFVVVDIDAFMLFKLKFIGQIFIAVRRCCSVFSFCVFQFP